MENSLLKIDEKIKTIFGYLHIYVEGKEINYSSVDYDNYLRNEALILDEKVKTDDVLECKIVMFDASDIDPYTNISVVVDEKVPYYKDNDDDTLAVTYEKDNRMLTIGFYKDDMKCSLTYPLIYGDYRQGIQLYKRVDVLYCVVSWVGDKVMPYRNKQGKISYDLRTNFASDGFPSQEVLGYLKEFIAIKKPSSPYKFFDYLKHAK